MITSRALNLSDTHFPFEYKAAYDLSLEVAQDLSVDEINILGDWFDFYWFSSHQKSPTVKHDAEYELYYGKEKLIQLRSKFPTAKINFLLGNHDDRFFRYLASNAPHMYGFIHFRKLLKLDKLDINYFPYGAYQKVSILDTDLYGKHKPVNEGIHCAQNTAVKSGINTIFGHTHRYGIGMHTTEDGRRVMAYNNGWLGDARKEVFQYVKNVPNWQLAFSITTKIEEPNCIRHYTDVIPFISTNKGIECMVENVLYSENSE